MQPETRKIFETTGQFCRTGKLESEIPGLTPGRLHHYRRLVFNVVLDTLTSAYPLSHRLLGDEEWEELVETFFSEHPCQNHQVMRMPEELTQFELPEKWVEKYPQLPTLLYFEWKELEYYLMEDKLQPDFSESGNPLQNRWAINAEHEVLSLAYPVHKIPAKEITPKHKSSYNCLVWRNPSTGNIHFFDLSQLWINWLLALSAGHSPTEIIEAWESQFALEKSQVEVQVEKLFEAWRKNGFVLGFEVK